VNTLTTPTIIDVTAVKIIKIQWIIVMDFHSSVFMLKLNIIIE